MTYLTRSEKSGIYSFRRAVPEPIQDAIGKTEWKESLRTTDLREAKRLVHEVGLRVEAEFQRALGNDAGGKRTEISREEVDRLAKVYLARILEEDEEVRMEGLDDNSFRKLQETYDIVDAGERYALARGDTSTVEFEVEDFIDSHELNIAPARRRIVSSVTPS